MWTVPFTIPPARTGQTLRLGFSWLCRGFQLRYIEWRAARTAMNTTTAMSVHSTTCVIHGCRRTCICSPVSWYGDMRAAALYWYPATTTARRMPDAL